jgi:ADP-heptose:LPS heptosyltransferase
MKRRVFRIMAWGGLGDMLLGTPIFSALKQEDPHCRIVVCCMQKKAMEVYKNNPNIDVLIVRSFVTNPFYYSLYCFRFRKFKWLNYGHYAPGLTYEKNATQIIADMFGMRLKSSKLEMYLTENEKEWGRRKVAAFKNPVLIHITSLTSKNQNWPLRNWEELVEGLPEYTFIQLGLDSEDKVEGAVDLRGKTSFREALSILDSSLSFVGVVSSFARKHTTWSIFDGNGVAPIFVSEGQGK